MRCHARHRFFVMPSPLSYNNVKRGGTGLIKYDFVFATEKTDHYLKRDSTKPTGVYQKHVVSTLIRIMRLGNPHYILDERL